MKRLLISCLMLGLLPVAPVFAQGEPAMGTGVNYETRLSTLEDSVRALNGQVEQLTYSIRRLDQSTQRLQADYDARLSKLENAQQQPAVSTQPAFTAQPQTIQPSAATAAAQRAPSVSVNTAAADAVPETPVNGTLGALKMQDGKVTGGNINPQAPPLPETPGDYGLTPQEQYDRAFGLLRQADYDNAEIAFRAFIDKNPKDKLIDNAKYWYGETLYVRGRFQDSAIAFADAYQQSPKGSKAPDSLLKLAMSLSNTGKTQDACTALMQLKSGYPSASSNVRSRAAEERTKLKCGQQQ